MATPKSQRIGIWIIAIVLTIGTLGSFAVMVLANSNSQTDQAQLQEIYAQYQADVQAQADKLSDKYYDQFSKYGDRPSEFKAEQVDKLQTKDLLVGDGAEIKQATKYSAYYIGWNPKGTVFDQSIEGDHLKAPISGGNLIEGWNKGVIGMKTGGVRLITIPAELAYGDQAQGENIPANTPLKFIVMAIPPVEQIPVPEELLGAAR